MDPYGGGGVWVGASSSRCLYGGYRYEPPAAGVTQFSLSQLIVTQRQGGQSFGGLYYTLHRHYDPVLMRFTSPDPAASPFFNLGAYVGNNPARFFDPDGLKGLSHEDEVYFARAAARRQALMDAMNLWGLFDSTKEPMMRGDASAVADAYHHDLINTDWNTVGTSAAYNGANALSGGWMGEFISAESAASLTGANVNSGEWMAGAAMGTSIAVAAAMSNPYSAMIVGGLTVSHGLYRAGRVLGGDESIDPFGVTMEIAGGGGMMVAGYVRLPRAGSSEICFVAGTQILTVDDNGELVLKPIEKVIVGDQVWSRDERTGEQGFKPVVRLYRTAPTALIHLNYRRESRGSHTSGDDLVDPDGILVGTPTHPFWSITQCAWVPMGELRPGERLALADGSEATVAGLSLETLDNTADQQAASAGHFTTFNFEVADWHTYYAAPEDCHTPENAVWVHNRGGPCKGFPSSRDAEKYVAKATGGQRAGKGSGVMTKLGWRKPDVTVAGLGRLIEVKIGRVRYSRFTRRQIAKDYLALKNRARNSGGMQVSQATWYFYKNRKGIVDVDPRVLRQLDKAGIHYKIFK